MDDLISRQEAVDAVYESAVGKQMLAGHRDLITMLKNLPAAQSDVPDRNVGDMIRRQDAIDAVCMDGCGLCRDAIEQIGGKND